MLDVVNIFVLIDHLLTGCHKPQRKGQGALQRLLHVANDLGDVRDVTESVQRLVRVCMAWPGLFQLISKPGLRFRSYLIRRCVIRELFCTFMDLDWQKLKMTASKGRGEHLLSRHRHQLTIWYIDGTLVPLNHLARVQAFSHANNNCLLQAAEPSCRNFPRLGPIRPATGTGD